MIKTRKRILITLTAMLLLYVAMTMQTIAADAGYLTDNLTLTSTTDASGTGYDWVASSKTLTITSEGLTIEATDTREDGIVLPSGSTIIINGELDIEAYRYGISCPGNLTIVANADTDITSWGYEGIRITTSGKVDITVASDVEMNISGDTAIFNRMESDDLTSVEITVYGELNLNPSNYRVGIETVGTVIFKGTGDIFINGSSSPIKVSTSNIYFGVDSNDTFSLTLGSVFPSTYSSGLVIADNVTVNGQINYSDKHVVYGDYTVTSAFALMGDGTNSLELSSGSTITINEDVEVDLTTYTSVDYNDATIINNGTLLLPSDVTDIGAMGITGSGVIAVIGVDGASYFYTNDGTYLYVEGTVTLGDTEVTTSSLYKWTKDLSGVYTLELFSENNYDEISFSIEVEAAMINLIDDVKVDSIEFRGNNGASLIIGGDYTLSCIDAINGIGTLIIEEGTTLDAPVVYLDIYSLLIGENVLSDLVVSGTLKSNFVYTGNLEVTNTGAVYLTSLDDLPFYSVNPIGVEPTLTLGEQVKIISPEGAYYSVMDDNGYYFGTFYTSEGDYVQELYIGQKPYYDIMVTVIGDGTVSPDGNIVPVMEGFDKEFTFTPADGCEILDVTIDGVSYGVIESYTFENVMTDYILEVEFSVTEDDEDDTDIPEGEDDTDTPENESVVPSTADSANIALYIALMIFGLGGFVVLTYKSKFQK